MNTQKISQEYRMSQWIQIIQNRHDSGQNVKDFCEKIGIKKNSYYYWQRKVREAACAELMPIEESVNPIPNGWMQLSQTQKTNSSLDIEVSGCRITVDSDTDSELLKSICRTLRSL